MSKPVKNVFESIDLASKLLRELSPHVQFLHPKLVDLHCLH